MSLAEIKKILTPPTDFHYVYVVKQADKQVIELRISDYEECPEEYYSFFPYEICGYYTPFELLRSLDWQLIVDEEDTEYGRIHRA